MTHSMPTSTPRSVRSPRRRSAARRGASGRVAVVRADTAARSSRTMRTWRSSAREAGPRRPGVHSADILSSSDACVGRVRPRLPAIDRLILHTLTVGQLPQLGLSRLRSRMPRTLLERRGIAPVVAFFRHIRGGARRPSHRAQTRGVPAPPTSLLSSSTCAALTNHPSPM
jgi:hypothetical protein